MVELVCIRKAKENLDDSTDPAPFSRAVVPTIDIYTAKVIFDLTQRMVEDTVDKRVSLLEKKIEERDMEIMRSIRRIQSGMAIRNSREKTSWWQRLFNRRN
ncbi:MAG: hypothetical protein PHS52_01915 [Desulfotomaculaceae bacterium]|nr:hypothetical protein [Desulfotomaculaceae bacterium]